MNKKYILYHSASFEVKIFRVFMNDPDLNVSYGISNYLELAIHEELLDVDNYFVNVSVHSEEYSSKQIVHTMENFLNTGIDRILEWAWSGRWSKEQK